MSDIDLRAERERIGESQAEFAARFGVNQSTIHRWETEGVPEKGLSRTLIERVLPEIRLLPAKSPETETVP